MSSRPPCDVAGWCSNPPRRVHSVTLDPDADDWLESVTSLLKAAGSPKSERSEVARVALSELRRALACPESCADREVFLTADTERRPPLLNSSDPDGVLN